MSTTQFNPSTLKNRQKETWSDFRNFIKSNKNIVLLINVVFILATMIIGILVSHKAQKLLWEYAFRHFQNFDFNNYLFGIIGFWYFANPRQALWRYESITSNYYPYVYGLLFFFTLETIHLIVRYRRTKKEWEKYSLSYGIYENKNFLRLSNELYSLIGNIFAFGCALIATFLITGFSIFRWIVTEFKFDHNFFFEVCIFACFFWIGIAVYIGLNVFQWQHNYYLNFQKHNNINQKKLSSLAVWYFVKNYFYFAVIIFLISIRIPADLFIIYCFCRYFPWHRFSFFKEISFTRMKR